MNWAMGVGEEEENVTTTLRSRWLFLLEPAHIPFFFVYAVTMVSLFNNE